MTDTTRSPSPHLLTPQQVAQRLLEEATLAGWRSQGRNGLVAVECGAGQGFRPDDVDQFVHQLFTIN